MQDANPPEDFLQGDDLQEITYRSSLMPGWFRLSLGFLGCLYILQFFRLLFVVATLRSKFEPFGGSGYEVALAWYGMYLLLSFGTSVVAVMFFMQSTYAVKAGIPVLGATLLVGALTLAGFFTNPGNGIWVLVVMVLNCVALAGVLAHAYRIRRDWPEAMAAR